MQALYFIHWSNLMRFSHQSSVQHWISNPSHAQIELKIHCHAVFWFVASNGGGIVYCAIPQPTSGRPCTQLYGLTESNYLLNKTKCVCPRAPSLHLPRARAGALVKLSSDTGLHWPVMADLLWLPSARGGRGRLWDGHMVISGIY